MVGVVLLHQQLDGLEESVEVQEEGDQCTDLQGVVEHHLPADGQQHGLAHHAEELGPGAVEGVHVGRVIVGVAVVTHHVAVVDHVVPLAVVRGHDAHPVEALGKVGQDVGDAVPHPVVAAFRGSFEPQ